MRARLFVILLAAACGSGQKAPAPAPPAVPATATLAFRDVRVFDGERVLPRATVLVDGARIVAVGPDLPIPAGAELVEGAGHTILPGLIDAHAHIFDGAQLEQSLAWGVTTVLDMFTVAGSLPRLRADDGPGRADLRSAGTLATAPGGHGTEYGFPIPTLTTPGEAQAWVDARLAEGSDYIKIVLDDGSAYGRTFPTLDRATVAALIAAAHARDKLAVVHIGTYDEARAAIEAGADGLVHIFRDRAPPAEFGTFVASKKAFVVPTLAVLRSLGGKAGPLADDAAAATYLPPQSRHNLRATFPMRASGPENLAPLAVAQLRAAGVPILAGTDAPNPGTTYGLSVHDELQLLVAAGLSPTEALAAATAAPARAFRLADRGRIAAGQRADLLLVEGDPSTDITRTRALKGIWREGHRFDREAYRAALPTEKPAPAATFTPGVIATFDDGTLATTVGQGFVPSTDAIMGGTSRVDVKVADRALSISGEVVAGKGPTSWAGAMFMAGKQGFTPADLSAAKAVRFRARGDGKSYTVMVFAQRRGRIPTAQTFTAGKAWAQVELPWSVFEGLDGSDIIAVVIAQTAPGTFALSVDDFELR